MQVIDASTLSPRSAAEPVIRARTAITEEELRATVHTLALPRHYTAEPELNEWAGDWIVAQLQDYGYETLRDEPLGNVLAIRAAPEDAPRILVGAHYDSVPGCPGADDNASALAAMLACARCLATHAPQAPVCFVAFNREEDGLLGSSDFVARLKGRGLRIHEAHVLEMVGCRDPRPGSQRTPPGLPIRIPNTGDFLGLVANETSHPALDAALVQARTYAPDLPVYGLKLPPGAESAVADVLRSDHAPFWSAGIPALMWTDTAEYRNPHYHQPTDLPETLDYAFLLAVTRLLVATVLAS
ncbi:MAG: M28 family peptidase [Actinomycetota bacterium]